MLVRSPLETAYYNIKEIFDNRIIALEKTYIELAGTDEKESSHALNLYETQMIEFRKKVINKINKSYFQTVISRHNQTLNMIEHALDAIKKLKPAFKEAAKYLTQLKSHIDTSTKPSDLESSLLILENIVLSRDFEKLIQPIQTIQAANDEESPYRKYILPILLQISEEDEQSYQELINHIKKLNSNADPISFLSNPIGNALRLYPLIKICTEECLKNLTASPKNEQINNYIKKIKILITRISSCAEGNNNNKTISELKAYNLNQYLLVSQHALQIEQKQYTEIAAAANQNRKRLLRPISTLFPTIIATPTLSNRKLLDTLSKNKVQDIITLTNHINSETIGINDLKNLLQVLKGSEYDYLRQTGPLGRFTRHYTQDNITKQSIKTSKSWATLEYVIITKIKLQEKAISQSASSMQKRKPY